MHCCNNLGYSSYSNSKTECWKPKNEANSSPQFELGSNRTAFGRLRDDSCELKNINKEAKSPGLYRVSRVQQVNNNSYMEHPTLNLGRLENRGINPCCIDDESELFNLTRKDSKCPTKKYQPGKGEESNCNKYKLNPQIIPESTRIQKSCDVTSGKSILNYQFNKLCENPQDLDKIHSNHFIGRNSRLCYKDDYKKKFDFKPSSNSYAKPVESKTNACCAPKNKQIYASPGNNSKVLNSTKHETYVNGLREFKHKLNCRGRISLN